MQIVILQAKSLRQFPADIDILDTFPPTDECQTI